jgi:hypothetical protein
MRGLKIKVIKTSEGVNNNADPNSLNKNSTYVFESKIYPLSKSLLDNVRIIKEAERKGKRFCPNCGSKMKTCCELHRQLNIAEHKPNGVHEGPEEWICLYCGIREYKDPAMRTKYGLAGKL